MIFLQLLSCSLGLDRGSYSQDGKLAELAILSLGRGCCHDRCLAASRLEAAQNDACLGGGVDRARICVSRLPLGAPYGFDFQPAKVFVSHKIYSGGGGTRVCF